MTSHHHPLTVQQLVLGADWACAHGDAGGLRDVIRQLSTQISPSLQRTVTELRVAVEHDLDVFACWAAMRASLVAGLRDCDLADSDSPIQRC